MDAINSSPIMKRNVDIGLVINIVLFLRDPHSEKSTAFKLLDGSVFKATTFTNSLQHSVYKRVAGWID